VDSIIKAMGGDLVKVNPDDRKDNVEKIQKNIDMTLRNMELADEMIEATDNPKTKEELRAKNERREQALDGLRKEIKDEAAAREKGYPR
jgi:small acid-soluble spore protein (thioredoxin-like protein)